MITVERLQELKKQGGTIWHWEYGEIRLEDTDICEESDLSGNHTGWVLMYFGKGNDVFLELKDLEEDADRGKWKSKTTAERTEKFEPPMWDEIEDYSYRFVWAKQFILLDIHKDDDDESDMSYIHIYNFTDNGYIFYKIGDDATKENYIKACEIVRDLFNKGGAK